MKVRSLSLIRQLSHREQLAEISLGVDIITENVFNLSACTAALRSEEHKRGCRVLKYLTEEETAKVLILMDYVRLPQAEHEKCSRQIKYFYDHFVRCLYAETYNTLKASNWAEVCTWVEQSTPSHYLDGPNDVDWIFRNDLMQRRETALYVDYVALDDDRRWFGPRHMDVVTDWNLPPITVELLRSMSALGLFRIEMLSYIHEVWSSVAMTPDFHWSKVEKINRSIVEKALSTLPDHSEEHNRDAKIVIDLWSFPLGHLELRMIPIDESELRLRQSLYDPS